MANRTFGQAFAAVFINIFGAVADSAEAVGNVASAASKTTKTLDLYAETIMEEQKQSLLERQSKRDEIVANKTATAFDNLLTK